MAKRAANSLKSLCEAVLVKDVEPHNVVQAVHFALVRIEEHGLFSFFSSGKKGGGMGTILLCSPKPFFPPVDLPHPSAFTCVL